uniref:RNA polymerase sigma-24 subunit ECF subfamily n=1 Tax=uncultured bacterium BLR5 TaxID=506522 RepID=C0INW3_9BACT|nr:RNA polymerase sigma-24 subunit ECF subfamily [uncultured bacterium BLR5]
MLSVGPPIQYDQFAIRPDQSVTELLLKWGGGDKTALDELIPLVYDELRRLAASYLRRRSGSNTLQATALVHEAYVRLADQKSASLEHRAQRSLSR